MLLLTTDWSLEVAKAGGSFRGWDLWPCLRFLSMRVLHSHLNWLVASQEFELVLELGLVGIDPVFESAHLVMEMVFSLVFVVTTPDNRANRLIWRDVENSILRRRHTVIFCFPVGVIGSHD